MTEQELIDLYWRRSERALSETEQRYGAYCRSIAYHLLRSREDTEESVNDTWLAAWNAMPPQRPNSLRAFLGKLTRNIAISRLRGRESQKRGGGETLLALEELAECLPGGQDPVHVVEVRELATYVNAFLETLTRRERSLFLGRYFYGFTEGELANRLDMKQNSVHTVLYRTRGRLRELLKKEGIWDE